MAPDQHLEIKFKRILRLSLHNLASSSAQDVYLSYFVGTILRNKLRIIRTLSNKTVLKRLGYFTDANDKWDDDLYQAYIFSQQLAFEIETGIGYTCDADKVKDQELLDLAIDEGQKIEASVLQVATLPEFKDKLKYDVHTSKLIVLKNAPKVQAHVVAPTVAPTTSETVVLKKSLAVPMKRRKRRVASNKEWNKTTADQRSFLETKINSGRITKKEIIALCRSEVDSDQHLGSLFHKCWNILGLQKF
jgi:hypothetical protein